MRRLVSWTELPAQGKLPVTVGPQLSAGAFVVDQLIGC